MDYKLFRGFINRKGEKCVVAGGSNGEGGPDYNKADKVSEATAGNLAGLDENGNLTDSGKKASDFAEAEHEHNGYAPMSHQHNIGDITGLESALSKRVSKQDDILCIVMGRTWHYTWEDTGLAEETLGQILALSPTPHTPAVCMVNITDRNNAVHRCLGLVEWNKTITENNGHTTAEYSIWLHIGATTLTGVIYAYDDGFNGYSMREYFGVAGDDLVFNVKSQLDSKMPKTAQEVSFSAGQSLNELLPLNNTEQFTNLWLYNSEDVLLPVVAHVTKINRTNDVHGFFVCGRVGHYPFMVFYFGNYRFYFTANEDADELGHGDVEPSAVQWDLTVSSMDNLLTL